MKTHKELAQIFLTSGWKTIGDDTQYKIKEMSDEYIIAFYGSNSDADWKNNFNFPQKPYKHMATTFYVHRGFLKAWKLIHNHFLSLVSEVDKPITIIGHSYGGAIATLCMEDIWFNYPEKRDTLRLITFGSPRVIGWWHFKKIKERWNNSIRYVNNLDIVPKVPFFLFGFIHVKKRTLVNKHKSIKQFFNFIENHQIENYQ